MNADDEATLRRSQGSVSRAPTGSAARNKRQDEFNQIFELTHEELLEDFSCAYQSDKLLYHGRMYVSRNYVCFHSQIFKKTIKILEFKDIQDVQKKNTAIVFPNALELTAKNRKFLFASFLYRDQAYKLLADLWEESKRNRVFKSLAVKEARKKHEEDAAREASFEAVSEASTEDEDQEESEEEGSSSEGEATDDAAPPILPRSAPTPVVMTSSPYASAESVSLAPPDDGAPSAKSVSPPSATSSTSSTQPSPPSNSALRNLSANISHNVNGWVNSVGWPINKLRADDGSGENPEAELKKDIELKDFASDSEDAANKPDEEGGHPSSLEEQREPSLKDPEHSTSPMSAATATTATEGGAAKSDTKASDEGGDREPAAAAQKSDDAQNKEKAEGGDQGEEKAERGSGSRRKRREDKEKADEGKPPEAPPVVAQTAVPVLETCSHISAGWTAGQSMVNVLLPVAVGDMFYTFFDDKNPDVPVFWNELHTQEPLSYTEVSMGQWSPQAENCCLRRSVGFRVALKHPLGPKSTRVQQEQRIHYMNKDTLVMETTSASLDVPYGDTFSTDTRWVMSAATGPGGKPATRVTVNVDIKFTKSVWIKGVIQSSAVDGVSTYFPAWAEKAQRLLARKARAVAAATPASPTAKRTPRKGASTRSSKRTAATPGGETPSKLRKSRRRAADEEKEGPPALASVSGSALGEEDGAVSPGTFDTGFTSLPSSPREEESMLESLIHMAFPNLPIPRLPFSLSTVAGAVLLLALVFFLLPPLFSLPSLSGRVASLEKDLYAMRRVNAHLKDRVLFMQLALSALTPPADADPTGPTAGVGGPPAHDALPELWRYWKLHRLLRARVEGLIGQLRGVHTVLGDLHDHLGNTIQPSPAASTTTAPPAGDYITEEFLVKLTHALDEAAAGDDGLEWDLEDEATGQGGGFWSWVWALFKLFFVWLPLAAVSVAMLANTLGLLPPVLPFPLPLENALRPYVQAFLPLPPAFNDTTAPAVVAASSSSSSSSSFPADKLHQA